MALDKQRILNELGSVVNQLQSADCGCMGKLFNQGQSNPAAGYSMANCGGYRHGCCHGHGHNYGHSYNNPCAGEPCNAMNPNSMAMGRCNPPKLYADTYNYLNQNLMQPIVKDVYNDLKNLTPANTISNNPMAAQMGLSAQSNPSNMGGGMGYSGQGNTDNPMASGAMAGSAMQNTSMGNQLTANQMIGNMMAGNQAAGHQMAGNHAAGYQMTGNQMRENQMAENQMAGNQMTGNQMMGNQMTGHSMMGHMAGMGPQIVNMMTGDGKSKPANMEGQAQGGPLTGPMMIDSPNSPHGQVGITPLNQPQSFSQGQFNRPMDGSYAAQGYSNVQPQNFTAQNMYGGDTKFNNAQMNQMAPNMAQNDPNARISNMNSNPAAQQMSAAHRNTYGVHAPGVAKFNEIFPGVMQGLGGDLGFDPMAIAIQMNPANQQKAAMNTMEKLMNGNRGLGTLKNSALMEPALNGMKAAAANLTPQSAQGQNQPTDNSQIKANQQQMTPSNEIIPVQNQQANQNITSYQPQQQMYTAVTEKTGLNPQQYQQIPQQDISLTPQGQQIIDPRYTGAVPPATQNIEENEPGRLQNPAQSALPPQPMIREPIFPADTSKNLPSSFMKQKYFDYNTLGQPVQMMPAKMFRSAEPNLPQTLSPQSPTTRTRNDYMKYSNVKSTVSKTSLMADKPIGKVPSRSQLQQVYNQYKGSQSFTQQSIKESGKAASHSEAHLASNQINPARQQLQAPVERVGDMAAINPPPNATLQKVGHVIGHIGDVPAEKPLPDTDQVQQLPRNGKLRNGLQDMIYTSYPSSAAWSFHGHNLTPYYPNHRTRHRV